jgi:hypothetical protein
MTQPAGVAWPTHAADKETEVEREPGQGLPSQLGSRSAVARWEPRLSGQDRATQYARAQEGGVSMRVVGGGAGGGQRRAAGPSGVRSARQHQFHLSPPWTGQNNPSRGHCWAVTT